MEETVYCSRDRQCVKGSVTLFFTNMTSSRDNISQTKELYESVKSVARERLSVDLFAINRKSSSEPLKAVTAVGPSRAPVEISLISKIYFGD
jgi:hypothetical protein